jgi:hypothetical protein
VSCELFTCALTHYYMPTQTARMCVCGLYLCMSPGLLLLVTDLGSQISNHLMCIRYIVTYISNKRARDARLRQLREPPTWREPREAPEEGLLVDPIQEMETQGEPPSKCCCIYWS